MRVWWCGCFLAALGCGLPTPDARPSSVDGIEEIAEALTDLSAQCAWVAGTGTMTLVLEPDDIALIDRAAGGAIEVNGYACGGTATTLKHLDVHEDVAGDQILILDYRGGVFGMGTAASAGTVVDLGNQTVGDALKIVGTSLGDTVVFGGAGIAINTDAYLDIAAIHIETWVVNLDDGNDTFSGMGNAATGNTPFVAPLSIYGGAGNDTLRGGSNDDTLDGGLGDDTFVGGAAADGGDHLIGGPGIDTADYSARTAALTISIDDVADDGEPGEHDNVAADVEIVRGGSGDDHLSGGTGPHTLFGGPGNDTFDQGSAPGGADVMNGGPGIDTVSYAARSTAVTVTIDAFADDGAVGEQDLVAVDVENVIGGAGDDHLTGSAAANVLDGGAGNDTIAGGPGNDTLRGGTGTNILDGDAGDDRFDQGSTAAGDDTIHGGTGIDTVDYSARTADLVVVMDGTTPCGQAGEVDRIGTDVENLLGGAGDDDLTGNAGDNQLEGGAGVDHLYGGAGDDILDGGPGNDLLDCGTGDGDIAIDSTTASVTSCEL